MKLRLVAVLLLAVCRPVAAQSPSIEYTVSARNPVLHLYSVEMQVTGIRSTSIDLAMPAWSPGTYLIRDFAANIQQLEVLSRQNQPLQSRQIDKQSWRISKAAADDIRVRYRVYSTNLNDEMGDIVPAALFMYVAGQTALPVSVKFETDSDWKVYTSIEKKGERYHAADYDTLVGSPIFLGELKVLEFKSGAVPYRVVFSNRRLQMTELQVEADLMDLAEATTAMLGTAPFKEYTFLVKVQPASGASSIAYPSSSRITVGENDFVNETSYSGFLTAATQALVRTWYRKAGRPRSMQPYDYSREAYSRLLWFTEGVPAYIADVLLIRCGILNSQEYVQRVTAEVDALQRQPGRLLTSLEDASWNTWTRGDNGANAMVSYLLKGKIAGLLLDAEIRGRSRGAKSLVDVVLYLSSEAGSNRGVLAEDALESAILNSTGINVREFFESVVRGKGELEYNRYLEPVGLHANSTKAPATISFGIEFERVEPNQARIRRVVPASPAEAAKLDSGDVFVGMDGDRVTFDNLASRIHSKPLSKPVNLTVLRGERLVSLTIVPGLTQAESWSVEEALQTTAEQLRLRNAWLEGPRRGK